MQKSTGVLMREITAVTEHLRPLLPEQPKVAVVLGSGLGAFASRIHDATVIPYDGIPHFRKTTVEGHSGRMIAGKVGKVPVVALQGRWHFYEGYPMSSIVLPARAMCMLGVNYLVLTNAAGGINSSFRPGDLMLIEDHINLMGDNPLTGKEPADFGPRFPDLSEVYCKRAMKIFTEAADACQVTLRRGTYGALRGPTYETPAEVRMLRTLGCDAVGMSTVPEAIAARHLGVQVAGISCITNLAAGMEAKALDHAEVQSTAQRVIHGFSNLLEQGIQKLIDS